MCCILGLLPVSLSYGPLTDEHHHHEEHSVPVNSPCHHSMCWLMEKDLPVVHTTFQVPVHS